MRRSKTPEQRLAEAVYEMGFDQAEKLLNFIKAYGSTGKKEKPTTTSKEPAAAKAAIATTKTEF